MSTDTAERRAPAFRGALADELRRRHGTAVDDLVGLLARTLVSPDAALPVPPARDLGVWGPGGTADRLALDAVAERADAERG
ncbi:hypothetical protein, partial [Agromyces seonyuensis]|nr:hypothetical protein [Agromyces seonyuensis]